ncbi:hypothetical protein ACXR2U_20150 [Jatrophihabitans sp. YIM 134969]
MSTATIASSAPHRTVEDTARLLADAEREFDAALDAGRPMFMLSALDREVSDAARRHEDALAAARV